MFDDHKRLLYILIFAMIFGAVIFGALAKDNANARSEKPSPRTHEVTRVVRNSDDYFAGMTDRQITKHARIVCTLLRRGDPIETVVNVEASTIPASHMGVLLDSAISVSCREYRNALRDFIDRHS